MMNLKKLPIVYFKENGVMVAHCVPLSVSSSGRDLEEATRNIHDAVTGFIETCRDMGTLEDVLQESGFVNDGEEWIPPMLVDADNIDIPIRPA
jgi:predicted RNase H-like HicB family nuclease